jgi:hypothetical protein
MWRMGWNKWVWLRKEFFFANAKLKIHVRQLKSITYPKIRLYAYMEKVGMDVVKMQKHMAHFLSFTLGSSILDEWKCQTIYRFPSQNVWECKNLWMLMGPFIEIQPYSPLPKVVGPHGKLPMSVVMDPIWHPLNMWMI